MTAMSIASGTGTQRRPGIRAAAVAARGRLCLSALRVRLRAMASALAFRRRQAALFFDIHLCDTHRIVLPAAEFSVCGTGEVGRPGTSSAQGSSLAYSGLGSVSNLPER